MDRAEFEEKYGKVITGKFYLSASENEAMQLPENSLIPGDLILPDKGITELPSHLTIEGSLMLGGTSVESIGPHLTVKGALILTGSKLRKLPDHVSAGSMHLANSCLEEIGSRLTAGSSLDLAHSSVISIGQHLTVDGTLFLGESKIQTLSPHVTVKKLDLGNSDLTALPAYLTVSHSYLDLRGTKVKTLGPNTSVNGDLYLSGTEIKELPVNLWVGDDCYTPYNIKEYGGSCLEMENTSIIRLPDGLHVEILSLHGTMLEAYGKNVQVVEFFPDRALQGKPEEFDTYIVEVDGSDQEAVDFAFALKPRRDLIIEGGSPILPDNFDIPCTLTIKNACLDKFPKNVKVKWLELIDTSVPMLPGDLQVDYGEIRLKGKKVECGFEEGFYCKSIEIEDTSITSLPFNYYSIRVEDSPISELPANPYCPGSLYLKDTNISYLPKSLEIGELEIDTPKWETGIKLAPNSEIRIDRKLSWTNFPYSIWPENLLVFGGIELLYGGLMELPQGFLVNGNLDLQYNLIENLPEEMIIFGNLDISYTSIKLLPKSLYVLGEIHAAGTEVSASDIARVKRQRIPSGTILSWKNGKFVHMPRFGNFEILVRERDRALIRKICKQKPFWIEKRGSYNAFFS